jgi:cobalt/nickel transport system permease protein
VRDSTVTDWARRSSSLHRRNSTCKLVALLAVLIAVATCPPREWIFPAVVTVMLLCLAPVAALPAAGVAIRAALVVVFVLPFALMIAFTGDTVRAATLVGRTYSSAVAIVTYAGATPVPETIAALRSIRFPPVLVEVIQFVYRYLFVIGEQARSMAIAAKSRGAARITASAGSVATLFARSYERADAVHRAMLSRGYSGDMPELHRRPATAKDIAFVGAIIGCAAGLRAGAYLLSK